MRVVWQFERVALHPVEVGLLVVAGDEDGRVGGDVRLAWCGAAHDSVQVAVAVAHMGDAAVRA
jgi:hypothetical protein